MIAVVAFHSFPNLLPGGFVGVDVFFVISGYLISLQLFGALDQRNFQLLAFYGRRIRRIFPALALVMLACMIFGWFALFAHEYAQLGKHVAGGAGFIANFVLLDEVGYFNDPSKAKPLLHLWSLGVEEQFYAVWPLMVWLMWFCPKRRWVWIAMTAMAGVSFAQNIVSTTLSPTEAFYLPYMRFWEFLAGALLAMAETSPKAPASAVNVAESLSRQIPSERPNILRVVTHPHARSAVGAGLIVLACTALSDTMHFPGWLALLPVIGAALIISAGTRGWFNRTVLAHPLMVWIGLISFPLYLWHWPLLSFAHVTESGDTGTGLRIVAVLLSGVLAWATYQLVERPMRGGGGRSMKTVALIASMTVVGYWGLYTFDHLGRNGRDAGEMESRLKKLVIPHNSGESDGSCQRLLQHAKIKGEVCQAASARPEILVMGDSHAIALNSAVQAGKTDFSTLLIAGHGCLPFEKFLSRESREPIHKNCLNIVADALDAAARHESIHTIVLATRGPYYFTGTGFGKEGPTSMRIYLPDGVRLAASQTQAFLDGYSDIVRSLLATGKKVVFLIDVPELGIHPRQCLAVRPLKINSKPAPSCVLPKEVVLKRQTKYRELVAEIQRRNPSLYIYDSLGAFCDQSQCFGVTGGQILYWDADHVSLAGSSMLLRHMRDVVLLYIAP